MTARPGLCLSTPAGQPVQRRLAPEAEAFTHGLGCFRRIEFAGHAHTVLQTGGGRAATEVDGARWVNVLLSNLKRALDGVYHAIRQSKYAGRYLAEAAYRFHRRFKLRRMARQLGADLMGCKPCPEWLCVRRATSFTEVRR